MDRTRRSLCGLGIASVPLAVIGPKLLPAAQEAGSGTDPLLAYLAAETARNCGASRTAKSHAGAIRASARCERRRRSPCTCTPDPVRRSGPNGEAARARRRDRTVTWQGAGELAARCWPDSRRRTGSHRWPTWTMDALRLASKRRATGMPKLGAVRHRWNVRRISSSRARDATPQQRQSDRRPAATMAQRGGIAGIGDPGVAVSCHEVGVLLGALGRPGTFPEWPSIVRPMILNFVLSILRSLVAVAPSPTRKRGSHGEGASVALSFLFAVAASTCWPWGIGSPEVPAVAMVTCSLALLLGLTCWYAKVRRAPTKPLRNEPSEVLVLMVVFPVLVTVADAVRKVLATGCNLAFVLGRVRSPAPFRERRTENEERRTENGERGIASPSSLIPHPSSLVPRPSSPRPSSLWPKHAREVGKIQAGERLGAAPREV